MGWCCGCGVVALFCVEDGAYCVLCIASHADIDEGCGEYAHLFVEEGWGGGMDTENAFML